LLTLFLLGELERRSVPIPEPFLRLTEPLGLESVTFLYHQGRPVGVLSTTVIVRPLPDLAPQDARLPERADQRPVDFGHFLRLLDEILRDHTDTAVGRDISDIVHSLRLAHETRYPALGEYHGDGDLVMVPLLQSLEAQPANPVQTKAVNLLIATTTDGRRKFVPKCEGCGRLLTRREGDSPIHVTSDVVPLTCDCGQTNNIRLKELMIWRRDPANVVVWLDRSAYGADLRYPPVAQIDNREVRFRWNPAVLGGDTQRIILRLFFPHCNVAGRKLNDIFFNRLLVPGVRQAGFSGLPLKPEWTDALMKFPLEIEATPAAITYRDLNIRGWPAPFAKTVTDFLHAPHLSVGVYPRRMHPEWNRYRIFAVGETGYEVALGHEDGGAPFRALRDVTNGWPENVSCLTADRSAGVTWNLASVPGLPQPQADHTVCLGVDFGTSNSVVYFQSLSDQRDLEARSNAVRPDALRQAIHWVSAAEAPRLQWMLPEQPVSSFDPYLFPSACWDLGGELAPIRWGSAAPRTGAKARHGFKWDSSVGADRSEERFRYLRELLFWALPFVLVKVGEGGPPPGIVRLGLAFPLAFSDTHRERFKRLWRRLVDDLRATTALQFPRPTVVNESVACVNAFGAPQPGEHFLVADMGGGTTDVALFEYRANRRQVVAQENLKQIGSIDFGGEVVLGSLARQMTGAGPDERGDEYWQIRDAIMAGTFAADNERLLLLDRQQIMALELLRTMAEAQLHGGNEVPIKIVLAGNGWRLRRIQAEGANPENLFREFFVTMIANFGNPLVSMDTRGDGDSMPSKHWVAVGVLYAARLNEGDELEGEETLSRLPAGRSLVLRGPKVEWFELVGGAGWRHERMEELANETIECCYEEGAAAPDSWRYRMSRLPQPLFPEQDCLRRKLREQMKRFRILKGPLQIIMETHWKKLLGGQ
jgi:hypothetical protein